MKVLLIGSKGQLGQALLKANKSYKYSIIESSRSNFDLQDTDSLEKYILDIKPNIIINTAAYTDVDKAEQFPESSYKINAEVPRIIAESISKINGKLLHYSTDFVFDGNKSFPYEPLDQTNPISEYGKSKAQGEKFLIKNNNCHIVRTSWLYGWSGKNFCLTILKLHKHKSLSNDPINVISDQIGVPTSTNSLANISWLIIEKILENHKIPRIIHWCDGGVASWYEFAKAIGDIGLEYGLISKTAAVIPIKSSDYKSLAKRPKYSVMNCSDTRNFLNIKQVHWRDELRIIIKKIKEI